MCDNTTTEEQIPYAPKVVFVCGPIYRCGSTLMQRVLNSHPEILIYGEDNNIIKLGRVTIASQNGRREAATKQDAEFRINNSCWQANLGEARDAYTKAYGVYISQILLSPQRAENLNRDIFKTKYVGCKSLFNTPEDIQFLKWLLPSSKIIYCARNFGECARSYMKQEWATITLPDLLRMWSASMDALDEARHDIDLVIDYKPHFDTDEIVDALEGILPNITFDRTKVKAVLDNKIVFEKGKPVKEDKDLKGWMQYL